MSIHEHERTDRQIVVPRHNKNQRVGRICPMETFFFDLKMKTSFEVNIKNLTLNFLFRFDDGPAPQMSFI